MSEPETDWTDGVATLLTIVVVIAIVYLLAKGCAPLEFGSI